MSICYDGNYLLQLVANNDMNVALILSLSQYIYNAVKCNLTELTTKSTCIPLDVSRVDTYAHVSEFHVLVDCSIA